MSIHVESLPLWVPDSAFISANERLRGLDEELPGKLVVVPAGNRLFHMARWVDRLVSSGAFDPDYSEEYGAVFLTDTPSMYSNCTVQTQGDLVLFDYDLLAPDERERFLAGNWPWGHAEDNLGFDGKIMRKDDDFCVIEEGRFATEVMIFPSAVPMLGGIAHYDNPLPVPEEFALD